MLEEQMARKPLTVEEIVEAVDSMSFEDMAQIKVAAEDKMASMKHLVRDQLKEELEKKMKAFGFTPQELGMVAGSPVKGPRKAQGERKRASPQGECPICHFATDEPHYGRKHRSQGENKRPFTDEELGELGLRKVA